MDRRRSSARRNQRADDALHELRHDLGQLDDRASTFAERLTPFLIDALDAEGAVVYALRLRGTRFELEYWHSASTSALNMDRADAVGREFYNGASGELFAYDAARPNSEQRNRALPLRQLAPKLEEHPTYQSLVVPCGLAAHDQLRALVCDGPRLLAWVGVFRAESFTERDAERLQELVPALGARFARESLFADAGLARAGLWAAMEAMSTPAFLVDARGTIVHVNELGAEQLKRRRHEFACLANVATLSVPDFEVIPVCSTGMPQHYLVVQRSAGSAAARIESFCREHRLTPRQTEVVRLIATGDSNRTIAHKLGCAQRTVDVHVSAILRLTGCDSRTELVSLALRHT